MKIAYDAKRFFNNASGLGNYSRDLIRILSDRFPENSYVLLNDAPSDRGRDIQLRPGVSFLRVAKGFMSRQLKTGIAARKVEADIFHGLSGELPLKWRDDKIKKVVTIHDLIFVRYPEYYSWFDRKIHLWKFKKAAQSADLIIAISEQTKQDVIKFLNVPESKIRVVYQGCHHKFKSFISPDELAVVQIKFNLPAKFILSVGTIERRKNLLNTVKALSGTDIPLVVVGKKQKKYFKKVQKQAKKGKVNVQFLDGVTMDDLAAIYRLAHMLVYPSQFEGFGIPVIEALFSGTAVITGNISSLPEAGGPGALYVHPDLVNDLRSKIQFLWNNESEVQRRVLQGFQYVQRFNDDRIAAEIMKVYRQIF